MWILGDANEAVTSGPPFLEMPYAARNDEYLFLQVKLRKH